MIINHHRYFVFDLDCTALSFTSFYHAILETIFFLSRLYQTCNASIRTNSAGFRCYRYLKRAQAEADLLLGNDIAIEVKSTTRLNSDDFRGLNEVIHEVPVKRRILVSRDPTSTEKEGILCIPWGKFCERLWIDDLF